MGLSGFGFAYLLLDDLVTAPQYFDKADEIRTYNAESIAGRTWLYFAEHRYDELRDKVAHLSMFVPDHPFLLHWLGMVDIMEGNLSDAGLHLGKAVEMCEGKPSNFLFGRELSQVKLAYGLWQLGDIEAANALLDESSNALRNGIKNGNEGSYQFYLLAEIENIRDNRSKALQWLQKAFDSGFIVIRLVEMDPLLADLHDDPEFKEMTADFRARIAKMRERVENSDR